MAALAGVARYHAVRLPYPDDRVPQVPLRPIENDGATQPDAMKLGHGAGQAVGPLDERDAIDRLDERPVENRSRLSIAAAVGAMRIAGAALKLSSFDAIEQCRSLAGPSSRKKS